MKRLVLLILALATAAAGDPPTRFEFTRIIMGAEARLILYAENESHAHDAAVAAFDRMAELDAVMSDYRRDSELMTLCERAGEGPQSASSDLMGVLQESARIAELSGGAFDPTVGPVVRLWRQARRDQALPSEENLQSARQRVDHRAVVISQEHRTIELTMTGMQLDLGGIGKGYAADAAKAVLEHEGVSSCLIDMSGDILVGDPPPGREAWTISVSHGDGSTLIIELSNAAIATSGDTEQHVEIDGVRYSHIVDPRTGVGLTTRAASTVIAPTGAEADALASAACVLGPVEGVALVESVEGAECLVSIPGDAAPVRASTSGFPASR